MNNNVYDLMDGLSELIEAKKLLDDLLPYFDRYEGSIQLSDWDMDYNNRDCLLKRIHDYTNFDDSE